MRFKLICKVCGDYLWIRGSYDPSVNATELDDSDPDWSDACPHIASGGDYDIVDSEARDDDLEPHSGWDYWDGRDGSLEED